MLSGSLAVAPVESAGAESADVGAEVSVAESKSEVIVWSSDKIGSVPAVVFADATVSTKSVEKTIAQTALKRNDVCLFER